MSLRPYHPDRARSRLIKWIAQGQGHSPADYIKTWIYQSPLGVFILLVKTCWGVFSSSPDFAFLIDKTTWELFSDVMLLCILVKDCISLMVLAEKEVKVFKTLCISHCPLFWILEKWPWTTLHEGPALVSFASRSPDMWFGWWFLTRFQYPFWTTQCFFVCFLVFYFNVNF